MKKSHVFLVALAVFGNLAFAQIGENFQASSLILGGSISIRSEMGTLEDTAQGDIYVDLEPSVSFFVFDGFSLDISAYYDLLIPRYDETSYAAGLGLGARYYYVPDPQSEKGLAAGFGAFASLRTSSQEVYWIGLSPNLSIHYFLTSRIAASLYVSGIGLSVPMDSMYAPYVWLSPNLSLGFSYFLPSRERAISSAF